MAKIVLAGGTGNLGTMLITLFREQGHEVIVFTRQKMIKHHPKVDFVLWDAENLGDWQEKLEGVDVLINLCGLSINRRFTKKNREILKSSRIIPTELLGTAISQSIDPVKLWINFSGVSIFNGATEIQDETGKQYANDFLGSLAKDWEATFKKADTPKTQKIILRMSPILSRQSGMFSELYPLTKKGLGGTVGNGKQMIAWIHEDDFVSLVDWIVKNDEYEPIYHACSPNPVSNKLFMKELRRVCAVSFGIPLPSILAKIGSFMKQVDSSLLLESVPVTTLLTVKNGFQFKYPYIQQAFKQLNKSST